MEMVDIWNEATIQNRLLKVTPRENCVVAPEISIYEDD